MYLTHLFSYLAIAGYNGYHKGSNSRVIKIFIRQIIEIFRLNDVLIFPIDNLDLVDNTADADLFIQIEIFDIYWIFCQHLLYFTNANQFMFLMSDGIDFSSCGIKILCCAATNSRINCNQNNNYNYDT